MTYRSLGKVYVTGADGFIGSHLVEALILDGFEVTALCQYNSLGTFGWLNDHALDGPTNLHLILGDVRDRTFLESTIQGHQTVFHLASLIAIPFSYQAPQCYFDTNAMGTMNVANACIKNNITRLIHTSTSEVYGTAKYTPIDENHPLQGQSPYSASKISADMIIESFHKSFDLPAITVRPFNTYGPRQSLRAVIPTVISQILSGSKKISLGSLSPTRDFNFVSDTVQAFLSVAKSNNNELLGQVFNAGSGKEISIGDLVKLISRLIGVEVEIGCDDERKRPPNSEVERLLCNSSKIKKFTSWDSSITLEDGLLKTINWIKGQERMVQRSSNYSR